MIATGLSTRLLTSCAMRPATQSWRSLFRAGSTLHVNFYENAYTGDTVEDHLRDVERFVDRAEGLLGKTSQA